DRNRKTGFLRLEMSGTRMKPRTRWILLAAVVVAVALFVALRINRAPQAQHFTAKVERGDIRDVGEATGTINAVITVQVGSQVSGTIAKLFVDFNSRVHKSDIVALIDPALFKGAVEQASADLDNAKANLIAARANLAKAKAALALATVDYNRTVGLAEKGVLSQQQLDLAKADFDSANAAVGAAQANVTQGDAQVSQKEAALRVGQTNLNYTVIRSPIDGTVVARNVDVGQTGAGSLEAHTIFTIAQDLTKMLVYTKTDESDVGNIKVGKEITFKVDAFPKETFRGVVSQVRMNATTVQNVVTYDTIIEFANPDLKLFPGMTAYVTIPVASVQAVLKLPNTALRYKPPMSPEEILEMYKRYGIEGGERPRASDTAAAAEVPQKAASGESQPKALRSDNAVVWKIRSDNSMEPVRVLLGITDHSYTEITGVAVGQLKEGDSLIIRSIVAKSSAPGAQ